MDKDTTEVVSLSVSYNFTIEGLNGQVPSVTVKSPSGTLYTSNSKEYIEDFTLRTVILNITNLEVPLLKCLFLIPEMMSFCVIFL